MNDDWRSYPFQLVPGDSQLDFPAAEGEHPDQESDTWFIAGQLDAAESGRSFAFLTIFNKNRPGGTIVADFYTMALFDLDSGDCATDGRTAEQRELSSHLAIIACVRRLSTACRAMPVN